MTELFPFKVGAEVAPWPILGRKLAILATFFDIYMNFEFVLPFIYIGIKGKLSWKFIGPKLNILSCKKHKNSHISK